MCQLPRKRESRSINAASVACLIMVAACTAEAPHDEGQDQPGDSGGPASSALAVDSAVHEVGEPAREPMIVEHPDGTLFVSGYERANATTEQPPKLWRSGDGGATWERLDVGDIADGAKGNSDVDLTIAPDGTVYFLTMGFDRSVAEGTHVAVGVSRDVGTTWEWTYLSDTRGDDRPWIRIATDGTAHVVWNDGNGVSHAVSRDGGRSWTERERINDRGGSSHLAVGPAGEVAVRIAPISASGRQFDPDVELVAVSTDGGESWTKHVPPGTREWSQDPADPNAVSRWVEPLAWGTDGSLYYLWSEGAGLWLARSRDQGASWASWQVAEGDGVMFYPYLVPDGADRLAATWFSLQGEQMNVHVALFQFADPESDAAPVVHSTEPFAIDSWAQFDASQVPDPAGEYVPVIFLADGGLAVVTPIQNPDDDRFGFSFWRIRIPSGTR